ncbi:MAG: hypothetical protein LBU37_04615 [Tannerellaceae bacterium]|jgi:hypothetical protein|nr:hypothetical protein [Tannerellaceae bacterium]
MNTKSILLNLSLWFFVILTHAQGMAGNEKTGDENNDVFLRKTGKLFSFTQGGVLAGNSDNVNNAPFAINTSLNYAVNRNISAGVGVGVEFFHETHLPVTANVLYQFGNKRLVPFVMLQAGYQAPLESKQFDGQRYYWDSLSGYYYSPRKLDARGGFMANPSAGVIYYTKSGFGWSFAAGYRYQLLNYAGEDDYKMQIEYNRLLLQIGFIF